MAFKMRSPLYARTEPLKQGYGKVVEETGATKQTLKPKHSPTTPKTLEAIGYEKVTGKQMPDGSPAPTPKQEGQKKKLPQEVYDQLKSFDIGGPPKKKMTPTSKTPTIDKFMQMNERPKVSEPSYLEKVSQKHKIVKDALGPVVSTLTGISNLDKVGGLISPMLSPKSGPKSIIEGPSKRDIQEQKRKEEKAAEGAEARYELPAPSNMSSPMYNLDLQSAFGSGEKDESDKEVEEETGKMVEDEGETNAEKYQKMMDESESEYSDNPWLRGRIDVSRNKAQKARLEGRLDRRLERQEERANRVNLRNYHRRNKEGTKQSDVQNKKETKKEEVSNESSAMGPQENYLDQPSFIDNLRADVKESSESSNAMMPNRAGRPKNSNILMTSPVIKTGKHSAKEAVAKLRMRNIAQSE